MRKVRKLYEGTTVKRTPPINLKDGDEIYFGGHLFEQTVPASYFVQFEDVAVTDIGIIIKKYRALKEFITCYDTDFKNYVNRYVAKVFLRHKKIDVDPGAKYLLIFDNYSGPRGFFHWIADSLSRLVEIADSIDQYTVIMPEYFREEALYRDTIAWFDIKDSVYLPKDSYIKVSRLFVANHIAPSGIFHPQNVKKVQAFVWEKAGVDQEPRRKEKIYISRKRASRRFVENEDEVIATVEKHGFEVVYIEQYSFSEQVRLVANSEYLISIHGAALTHTWFMRPGSKIMEFRKKGDSTNHYYFSLASAAKLNYYYQFCEAREISTAGNNFNLVVDIEELNHNIQRMLSN